jgi:L-amino acid N-acyltransferase YncA
MKTTPLRNILYLLQSEGYSLGSKVCKALIDEQVQKGIWQLEQSILKEIAASKGKHGSAQAEWIEGADSAEAMELIRQCIKDGGY